MLFRRALLRKRMVRALALAESWRTTSEAEMEEQQLHALRACWREAVANVPYYRNLVHSRQAPIDFHNLEDYRSSVPILTRDVLMSRSGDFRRSQAPDGVLMTAGSSGRPLRFGTWRADPVIHTGINQWVGRLRNGMSSDDRLFLLWGHSHLLGTGFRGKWNGLLRRGKDWALGYTRANAYHLGDEDARRYLDLIMRSRARVVVGYACALDILARRNMAAGRTAKRAGIKLCIACAEVFPRDDSRRLLSELFACPVVMEYGGVDFGVCAYELLESGRYETFWWSHFLEVEGARRHGPLLVSNLTPRYFPLFRYRNGDECEGAELSGSGHVVSFATLKGRLNDVLEMPDGHSIHSVGLFHCIHQEPVWSIQLVVRGSSMRIRLAAAQMGVACEARIRRRLFDLHPGLGTCPIEVVDDVSANRAGKRRWIVHE